jgi:hypothetical protein
MPRTKRVVRAVHRRGMDMGGIRSWLTCLILVTVVLLSGADTAFAYLNYGRSGVGTNSSGYMLYGSGNYARIYVYPNAVCELGKKVTSIYLIRADNLTFAESGFMTIPAGGGEISFAFALRWSNWVGDELYYGPTVSPGTYPDTDLIVSGTSVDVYFNQTKYMTFPSVNIATGRGLWAEERNNLLDNGNGSFRYCQYKTSSGWVYWPYGVADYPAARNNDPQIHFVRTDLPTNQWAHFDY